MIRIPTDREPTHPGGMLLNEFLLPMKMTQHELATAIHVPYQRVNEVVRGRRGADRRRGWAEDHAFTGPYARRGDRIHRRVRHNSLAQRRYVSDVSPREATSGTNCYYCKRPGQSTLPALASMPARASIALA